MIPDNRNFTTKDNNFIANKIRNFIFSEKYQNHTIIINDTDSNL